eukprot:342697_1
MQGNYLCYPDLWTVVSGSWIWQNDTDETNDCKLLITNKEMDGSVIWIGQNLPDSLNWRSYIINVVMKPYNTDYIKNFGVSGILFRVLSVSSINNGGDQYTVAFFWAAKDIQVG